MTKARAGVESMPIRYLIVIFALTFLGACNSSEHATEKALLEMGVAQECDASEQSCLLVHDGAELQLTLDKEIRPLQPFHLQLLVKGIQPPIEAVSVEFFMEGMDMGINRYRLLGHGSDWQGEVTLPVCVSGRSDWRAVVEVDSQSNRYRGVFRFHSSR